MILDFVRDAEARLALREPERVAFIGLACTCYEGMHALLSAGEPREIPPPRRAALLNALWPLLDPRYRALLRLAPPDPGLGRGAAIDPVMGAGPPSGPSLGPPPDWPGLQGAESLVGEPDQLALLDAALAADWPPRDQGPTPTCVPFAACAALEAALGADGPGRLSAGALYRALRKHGSTAAGADLGATKLAEARLVLEAQGVPSAAGWPDRDWHDAAPEHDGAPRWRFAGLACWDRADRGWPGAARAVLEMLKQGRPVAVSLPEYQPKAGQPTNWGLPSARLNGEVPNRPPGWVPAPSGHAVCILGFQAAPAAEEPLGGWFIFRNSLGLGFASNAPDRARGQVPRVPAPGYGALSASHLDAALWELFAPPAGGGLATFTGA